MLAVPKRQLRKEWASLLRDLILLKTIKVRVYLSFKSTRRVS